jgi:hypothetical protein
MKNLVEGQEISKFKNTRGLSLLKLIGGNDTENFESNFKWYSGIIFLLVTGIIIYVGFNFTTLIFDYFEIYDYENGFLFFIILIIFNVVCFWILTFKFLEYLGSIYFHPGNPSVVYFNDCLFVITPPIGLNKEKKFKGEIPFIGIKRFIFKDDKEIVFILDKNSEFFNSEKFFREKVNNEDLLTFELTKELRTMGLQIVEELNSKLKKE